MATAGDVCDTEPLPEDYPLRDLAIAYLTLHHAGGVMASVERILNWLIDDIEAHLQGRPQKYRLTEAMVSSRMREVSAPVDRL